MIYIERTVPLVSPWYRVEKRPPSPFPHVKFLCFMQDMKNCKYEIIITSLDQEPGTTCYFSVTALYKDGKKVPDNAVELTIPEVTGDVSLSPLPDGLGQ